MHPQTYVKAHAAQTAIGPDAAAKSEAATAKLEEYESLSTTDALRCGSETHRFTVMQKRSAPRLHLVCRHRCVLGILLFRG